MNPPWFVYLPFAIFFFWFFIAAAVSRGKACPDCGEKLPTLQSPFTKTWRQWVEGGYICSNCGCETDIAGRKVASGTLPSPHSIRKAVGFLLLAGVPFIFLIGLLLRR